MINIKKIKYNSDGLVPVVTVCAKTSMPLMQAYATEEAIKKTISTKKAHYFSRSKNRIWKKGETSNNTQEVVSIMLDCDFDCVLYRVEQNGVACHTGKQSCFFNELVEFSKAADLSVLDDIERAIIQRGKEPQEGSYTNYLLKHGKEKVAKKIAEEAGEVVIASIKGDKKELAYEAADLIFHLLVMLNIEGIGLQAVLEALKERREKERERQYK